MPDEKRSVRVLLDSVVDQATSSISLSPHNVIVTSPYLTSPAIEAVIGNADPTTSIILTTFRAEIFATGASSLGTLRDLLNRGFQLRHLDGLHAKIIATENICFIGSQNLTFGGTQNREATAIIDDTAVVSEMFAPLREWLDLSSPISIEMVTEMEDSIGPIADRQREISAESSALDYIVRANERLRENVRLRHRQRKIDAELQAKESRLLLQVEHSYSRLRSVTERSPASSGARLSLQRKQSGILQLPYWTLAASPSDDLTQWHFGRGSEVESLEKTLRYFVVSPDTGKLGWVALNKTQITRFGLALTPAMRISVLSCTWTVEEIKFNRSLESLASWNACFDLRPDHFRYPRVELFTKILLDDCELVEAKPSSRHWASGDILSEFNSDIQRVSAELLRVLTMPFKYKANRHGGRGEEANYFCKGISSRPVLRLRKKGRFRYFSLERD